MGRGTTSVLAAVWLGACAAEDGPSFDYPLDDLLTFHHFLSTDTTETALPGGTPSRCNPSTAPPECTGEAIEDPVYVE